MKDGEAEKQDEAVAYLQSKEHPVTSTHENTRGNSVPDTSHHTLHVKAWWWPPKIPKVYADNRGVFKDLSTGVIHIRQTDRL